MPQFYTLLTDTGQAKIANAIALGTTIDITELAVGDGGGSLPTPDSSAIALVNEVRRAPINTSDTDPDNPSWIVVEQVLPPDVGGWTIREIGIYDIDGDLIGVGNYPETYKPVLAEGSSRTQTVRFVLEVSDTAAVTLKVDPSVVLATREYVDTERAAHEASRNHPAANEAEQGMVELATSAEVRAADAIRAVTAAALKASGLLGGAVTTVTAADSPKALTIAEAGLVLVDASAGAVSLTLPSAATSSGVSYGVVRTDSTSGNAVTINPDGTDTIGGAASLDVVVDDRRTLESDGASDWKRPEPLATETEPGMLPLASAAVAQGLSSLTTLLSPGRLADAFKGGNQSLAANGYQKLPGGLILQWGAVTSGNNTAHVFPVAFPNACFGVAIGRTQSPSDGIEYVQVVNFSANDWNAVTYVDVSAANTTGTLSCTYFAIGY